MNYKYNFNKWSSNDSQNQDTTSDKRNLGTQMAAILYVYFDIPNWFSEDELCTLLGYATRNHNVRQAILRMVDRDMLTSNFDSAGTEKYYLSEWPSKFIPRSPEDNPDIKNTNPNYAASITYRVDKGRRLINSRKQQKASPSQAATITLQTVATGVADAKKEEAKRTLHFKGPLQQNSNKRSKTTAFTASTAPTTFTANPSDSLESDEEPPTKPINLSQSSSSASSDPKDTDSEDTTEEFKRIIPEARNKGTDFNNVRAV